MWALADMVKHYERERWRKQFGTEFTGFSEGRPVRLTWRERTVGHVCVGNDPFGLHLECQKIVRLDWVWLRSKPAGPA